MRQRLRYCVKLTKKKKKTFVLTCTQLAMAINFYLDNTKEFMRIINTVWV